MGKNVIHCGGPGSGQAAKIANNMALAIQMASIAEAMHLGVRLGVDPTTLNDIFNSSSAQCWQVETTTAMRRGMECAWSHRAGTCFFLLDECHINKGCDAPSRSSSKYNPWPGVMAGVPASRNYEGGFLCSLMAKDLR